MLEPGQSRSSVGEVRELAAASTQCNYPCAAAASVGTASGTDKCDPFAVHRPALRNSSTRSPGSVSRSVSKTSDPVDKSRDDA